MTCQILQWTLVAMGFLIVLDILLQSKDVWGMLRYLRRENRKPADGGGETRSPKAAIILSLRGPDPRLTETLQALMGQACWAFKCPVFCFADHTHQCRC